MTDLLNWLMLNYGQETMRPGLERVSKALLPLLPQLKKSRIITIAGTNGKGETTLRLSEQLINRKHLAWTSPHVIRLNERFRNEQGEISSAQLEKLILFCHEEVKKNAYELSFYEFLFFVFCNWAVEQNPEFILLEVGLGGKLDAVNVLDAELVLLTSISRDHQEYLGNRYDQILYEKLGVLRNGKTLISYVDRAYLRERARKVCEDLSAQFIDLEARRSLESYEFSRRNQLLAHAAFLYCQGASLEKESFDSWVPEARFLANRGEVLKTTREWIFFGSHNPDGVRKLIQFLHSANYNFSRPPYDLVVFAFSRRDPKDLRTMLKMLKRASLGKVVVTSFEHPKAVPKEFIKELCLQEGIIFVQDINKHVQSKSKQPILVAGSYYFLGHLKTLLSGQSTPTDIR